MGFYPDVTADNSYMGWAIDDGDNPTANGTYPMVLNAELLIPGNASYADAASGAYNSNYAAFAAALASNNVAPYVYAIRIAPEWSGPNTTYLDAVYSAQPQSASGRVVAPAQFIAAFRNFAAALRANPATRHVKIAWDYPTRTADTSIDVAANYYPGGTDPASGLPYVDMITSDIYFYSEWNFSTSSATWAAWLSGYNYNLAQWSSFAASKGLPIGSFEWGDDNGDGYCMTKYLAWLKANNGALAIYWNMFASPFTNAVAIQGSTAQQKAFEVDANTAYSGTFFTRLPAPGSPIPAGF
jgi:hypothetical protein